MKRDMDLVRKILLVLEEQKKTRFPISEVPFIEGCSEDQVRYHIEIMSQANLLYVHKVDKSDHYAFAADQYSISWQGHEFIEAMRDDSQWNKIKSTMIKAGGFAFDIAFQVGKEIIKQAAIKAISA